MNNDDKPMPIIDRMIAVFAAWLLSLVILTVMVKFAYHVVTTVWNLLP